MQFKLIKKKEEAKDTMSFFFEPTERFDWLPGQYAFLTLTKLNYPDQRGATRHFTIASSPTEKIIQITTRIRQNSGFKKTLNELKINTLIDARAPFGSFIFGSNQESKNHVFLAGGIGITPFRSMIKYIIDQKINTGIELVYSNSDENFVFKDDLNSLKIENEKLKVKYINTSVEGRITRERLKEYKNNQLNKTFWIVGPNPFVDAMEEILKELNISSEYIKSEKFTGY